jgi:tetratricopeptide (TPR) repeat protein
MKFDLDQVESLRQAGLAQLRANQPEEAIVLFDQALGACEDDEQRELLSINKSFALITLERGGPEVQMLPRIIMRRKNVRHVFFAAYNLQYKYRLESDFSRARSYLKVAMDAAEETNDTSWKPRLLQELGNLAVFDSRIGEAIQHYREVLEITSDASEYDLTRAMTRQNLGYALLMNGELDAGIESIHEAIRLMTELGADGYIAESYLDLCFGYLERGDISLAREYGEKGLEIANEIRQIRNAHYLLGEAAYKDGDIETAEFHFEQLAKFYPDFAHLKSLLLGIDLRGMVNLKL